jgi:mRNA interferase MazF
VHRGEVYTFKVPKGIGHEQHGTRFGVVVQADELLPPVGGDRRADVPQRAPGIVPARDRIDGTATRVLVERLGAVDTNRLGRRSGQLSTEEL